MHVHSAFATGSRRRDISCRLFIANGVTGVRDMGGDIPVLFAGGNEIADGKIIGPHMIHSGPMLDALFRTAAPLSQFPSPLPRPQCAALLSTRSSARRRLIKVQRRHFSRRVPCGAAEARKLASPTVASARQSAHAETIAVRKKSIDILMGASEAAHQRRHIHYRSRRPKTSAHHAGQEKNATHSSLQLADSKLASAHAGLATRRHLLDHATKHDPLDNMFWLLARCDLERSPTK